MHHSCAAITISIAHEIGHILGARHDRAMDANDAPFAYGHGYVNGQVARHDELPAELRRLPAHPLLVEPARHYKGEPTGTAAEDNARVILEQAERVSKFR